jgi:hypothetical protein
MADTPPSSSSAPSPWSTPAGPIRTVRIDAGAAAVIVRAAKVDAPRVVRGAGQVPEGDVLVVRSAGRRVEVEVPIGFDVVVSATAGRVITQGHLGRVVVTAGAGRIDVEHAESVDVRAGAGRVIVERCVGECRLKVDAGRAQLGHVGSLHVMSDAGRIEARQIDSATTVRALHGRVDLGVLGGGDVDIETQTGRIDVKVQGTAKPRVTAESQHGRLRMAVPAGDDFALRVRTAHGRVTVGR